MLACTGVHVQQLGWDCQPPERPAQVALSASLGWVMQQPEQVPAGTRVCTGNQCSALLPGGPGAWSVAALPLSGCWIWPDIFP